MGAVLAYNEQRHSIGDIELGLLLHDKIVHGI